ncbi:MAG: hypothetical protein AAFQ07_09935 [Chloroflexota bacterium]
MADRPKAYDVNYWKSSKSSPDTWVERTKDEIECIGGVILSELAGTMNGKTAFMIAFQLDDHYYKIVYEVLPIDDPKDLIAAKRQAATAMYHEVKALCVAAKFRGVKAAFNSYLVLEDGRTVAEHTEPDLIESLPKVFLISPRTDN